MYNNSYAYAHWFNANGEKTLQEIRLWILRKSEDIGKNVENHIIMDILA